MSGLGGGIYKGGIKGGATWNNTIIFDKPFKKPPLMWCESGDVTFNAAITDITTTGFVYWIVNVMDQPNSRDVYPRWYAYGELA